MIINFDYATLLKEYFKISLSIKNKRLKVKTYIREKEEEIAKYNKTIKKQANVIYGAKAKKTEENLNKCLNLAKTELDDFLQLINKDIENLENRKDFLKGHLKNFKVDFNDILMAVFPDYNSKKYTITSSEIFGISTLKPLTTENILYYYEKAGNSDKGIFIEITVKNNLTQEETIFYKTFDFDHTLSDGTTIKENLHCTFSLKPHEKLFYNTLSIKPEKIEDLVFDFTDFHYNLPCQLNIDSICRQKEKSAQISESQIKE